MICFLFLQLSLQILNNFLFSNSKFSLTYGKVVVRAKLPRAKGTWPAIWTLGSNLETLGWPACGEIDILEVLEKTSS